MAQTLTRADLCEAVHETVGLSRQDCAGLVERTLDLIAGALENGKQVKLSGFGVFQVRAKRARMGRNPKTGEPAAIDVDARYLYGAPGAGLDVSGSTTIRAAEHSAIPGFSGYAVGLTDEAFDPVQADLEESATTDAKGHATIQAAVAAPDTTRPLEVEIALRIGEPGGRALARSVTLPIVPAGAAIGVKSLFGEGAPAAGGTAPESSFSKVDLPLPLGPTMPMRWRPQTVRSSALAPPAP